MYACLPVVSHTEIDRKCKETPFVYSTHCLFVCLFHNKNLCNPAMRSCQVCHHLSRPLTVAAESSDSFPLMEQAGVG